MITEIWRVMKLLRRLGPHERAMIREITERLTEGRKTYGEWTPGKKDDTEQEALEEIMDALNYVAARLVDLKNAEV